MTFDRGDFVTSASLCDGRERSVNRRNLKEDVMVMLQGYKKILLKVSRSSWLTLRLQLWRLASYGPIWSTIFKTYKRRVEKMAQVSQSLRTKTHWKPWFRNWGRRKSGNTTQLFLDWDVCQSSCLLNRIPNPGIQVATLYIPFMLKDPMREHYEMLEVKKYDKGAVPLGEHASIHCYYKQH